MADVVRMRRRQGTDSSSLDDRQSYDLAPQAPLHRLDRPEAREKLRKLLEWYYFERDRQAANRLEMAMDHDIYDCDQWSDDDRSLVEERGQVPLVYNETAPMIDWITGTQRRAPVDWSVLPRAEDDVKGAEVKTKAMKYVADVNKVQHHRSRAFGDAAKGGLGWLDDGTRDDPTKEIIYSRYEDWRHVLHDSTALDLMGEDGRYIFRWRWVDEDIACMMFPDRKDRILRAVEDQAYNWDEAEGELDWQTPGANAAQPMRNGTLYPMASSSVAVDAQRRRVKLIECQWREPGTVKFVADGPMRGALYDERDKALAYHLGALGGTLIDRIALRVHVAVFTESDLLAMGPSAYRHNKFSLTPVICFRKGRSRQPYGFVRRVRDIQRDINKRASKALFLLSTNQIIADRGAVEDLDLAAEEVADPQGRIEVEPGMRFEIRRDTEAATGQLQLMSLGVQAIQRVGGVPDENMGRKTNAVSGEAIKARQMQGAVVTTEIFDNLRLSVQTQGEKQLSLIEQYMTEERVIRLTGSKGKIEWLKVNRPEVQADGSVRYLDDVTASMADFVVAETDYSGTLRQVMFESLNQLAMKLSPEVGMKLLRMAFEFSDLPNHDEIVDELRKITGEQDPDKELTPEEAAQAEQQMQAQAELLQMQRAQAMAALEEQQAKAAEVKAKAAHLMAKIEQMRAGGDGSNQAEVERAVMQVREQLTSQIESLSGQLQRAQADRTTEVMKIRAGNDSAAEVARIKADGDAAVAEIQAASDQKLQALMRRIEDLTSKVGEMGSALTEAQSKADKLERDAIKAAAEQKAQAAAAPAPAPAAAPAAPAPAQPVTVLVTPTVGEATVAIEYGEDGRPKAATMKREDGSEVKVNVARSGNKESKQ